MFTLSKGLVVDPRIWTDSIVELTRQITDKAKINTLLYLSIEIVFGNQIIQRDSRMLLEVSSFATRHDTHPSQVQSLGYSLKLIVGDT